MADSFSPFWRDTTVPPGWRRGAMRSSAAPVCCALTASSTRSSVAGRPSGVTARTGVDQTPSGVTIGEAALVHGQDVVGRLIDQQHVVPGARQRRPRDPADRTRPDDRDVNDVSSRPPRWRHDSPIRGPGAAVARTRRPRAARANALDAGPARAAR